jgi:hypothetical protein
MDHLPHEAPILGVAEITGGDEMSNRELLEMAAKAAGIDGFWIDEADCFWTSKGAIFNPLHRDDHALKLAVKLRLTIDHKEACVNVWDGCLGTGFIQNGDDPGAATRLAIVRAAAEIGRVMK